MCREATYLTHVEDFRITKPLLILLSVIQSSQHYKSIPVARATVICDIRTGSKTLKSKFFQLLNNAADHKGDNLPVKQYECSKIVVLEIQQIHYFSA